MPGRLKYEKKLKKAALMMGQLFLNEIRYLTFLKSFFTSLLLSAMLP